MKHAKKLHDALLRHAYSPDTALTSALKSATGGEVTADDIIEVVGALRQTSQLADDLSYALAEVAVTDYGVSQRRVGSEGGVHRAVWNARMKKWDAQRKDGETPLTSRIQQALSRIR